MRPTLALALLVPLAAGCRTAATELVPDPPPEAADWSRPDPDGGAYLGLETVENDSGRLDDLFFEPGVRVVRVDPNSPADAAGLRVGDVVLALDGDELLEPESLDALVSRAEGGRVVRLEVRRDDTIFEVPVALRGRTGGDELGEVRVLGRVDPVRLRARLLTEPAGVRLLASADDAPLPAAGVPVGSLLHAVDGRAVASARELVRLVQAREPGERVEVEFTDPDGRRASARVRLTEPPRVVTGFTVPVLATYVHEPDQDRTRFVLLDLWLVSLFRYEREGAERRWRLLRFFGGSSGVGELSQ